jgi:hypothetical protein
MRPRIIAPQTCIRSIRVDRNHDAVMRIGGAAPGRRAHTPKRLESHVFASGHRHLGSSSTARQSRGRAAELSMVCSGQAAHAIGHKTMPLGTSPVLTKLHNATSSFLARATIMVLRMPPRASAVRARYHWASALFC